MSDLRHYFWSKGEPWNSVRSWLLPQILRAVHSTLMCTVRITTSGVHQARPFLEGENEGPGAIFVVWHDSMFMPMHLFRRKKMSVIVSHSHSGQIAAAVWSLHGMSVIWGSTKKREGIQALRDALNTLRSGCSIGFTPDGPIGPRHQAQPGVVYLASNAPSPALPLGVAASSCWRLPTWDRHFIPKPFSRVHMHLGAPLQPPPDLSREETAQWQQIFTEAIKAAEETAHQALATPARASVKSAPEAS